MLIMVSSLKPCPFFFLYMLAQPPISTLFPYTTLFRSARLHRLARERDLLGEGDLGGGVGAEQIGRAHVELQSRPHLVCRLLLEKKKQHRLRPKRQQPAGLFAVAKEHCSPPAAPSRGPH